MASLPTVESLLLEIHQSLCLPPYPSRVKEKFALRDMPMENLGKMRSDILSDICTSLGMDEKALRDAAISLHDWEQFHSELELQTWTGGASERQIVWHLLAHSYLPMLARRIAFWNLEGAFDHGMPGGQFWFLPHLDNTTTTLRLPVPQVVEWVLDLLGTPSDQNASHLGSGKRQGEDKQSIDRNLNNWKRGQIPHLDSINKYFPDDAVLAWQGTFLPGSDLSHTEQYKLALDFVQRKQLSADALRSQIPMTQAGRIEALLDHSASHEEQQEFVRLLTIRYAKPGMRLVRQRLVVARMIQDGYARLLAFLFPGTPPTCADPRQNRLLPLFGVFANVYNLTIDAWKKSENLQQEDLLFEASLPPWDRTDIFLSILPSLKTQGTAQLAQLLSRRFARLADDDALPDFVPPDAESAPALITAKLQRLRQEHDDDARVVELTQKMYAGSPWRTLQKERSYDVVSQLALADGLPGKVRQAALQRLHALAASPSEIVGAIVIELAGLLNCRSQERPSDARQRVELLLAQAEASSGHELWKAPLLQYGAKHLLAQGDFDTARTLFRSALEACSERNFGPLRGEIARDLLASEVANQGLIPGNHQKYYRNMVLYGMFEEKLATLEDTAVWASEYFWEDLYQPYHGVGTVKPLAQAQAQVFLDEALPLILQGDWLALQGWMKRHARLLRQHTIKEVRGDTVLMNWLKMLGMLEARLPQMRAMLDAGLEGELLKMEQSLGNWRHAIGLLATAWPNQVNATDFKRQTPLMLAADAGDAVLVQVFLSSGANLDAQDYLGRTALHAAVAARSAPCVAALLERRPDLARVCADNGHHALHTATSLGYADIAAMLISHAPQLATQVNGQGRTALELLQAAIADISRYRAHLAAQCNRVIGSEADFVRLGALFDGGQT